MPSQTVGRLETRSLMSAPRINYHPAAGESLTARGSQLELELAGAANQQVSWLCFKFNGEFYIQSPKINGALGLPADMFTQPEDRKLRSSVCAIVGQVIGFS